MAIDKADTGAAQVEATKTAPKKVTKKAATGDKKKTTQMQKVVNDAKSMYSDLDMSEGRKMRKRPASSAPAVAKKPKKAATTKKAPAAKKTTAKKGAKAAADENKNE